MAYNTVSTHQKHAKSMCFRGIFMGISGFCGHVAVGAPHLNIADILTQAPYSMELHPDDLKRLARLARIAVSDSDVALLQSQLNGIFGLIDELQAVDTKGIEPLSHPLDVVQSMAQRLREDRVTELDHRSAHLANAPAQENGLFLVPKVIE